MRHGGDLGEASRQYGRAEGWLDLSTGVNPRPWPATRFDWSDIGLDRLPSSADLRQLLAHARSTYRVPYQMAITATPGSDIVIRNLPDLCGDLTVIASTSYQSYFEAWRTSGRPLSELRRDVSVNIDSSASIILVNPNNPDGRTYSPDLILALARSRRDHACVIVDEAFADAEDELSVVPQLQAEDRILVLKSFGKFFGLPGLRLGFVVGAQEAIDRINGIIGDWPVSAPALAIGTKALSDTGWQAKARVWLDEMGQDLDHTLAQGGLEVVGGCRLFRLVRIEQARLLHHHLATHGIWTRSFDDRPDLLRMGLPANSGDLNRLQLALSDRRLAPGKSQTELVAGGES